MVHSAFRQGDERTQNGAENKKHLISGSSAGGEKNIFKNRLFEERDLRKMTRLIRADGKATVSQNNPFLQPC